MGAKEFDICVTEHWRIVLHPVQYYLGRCVLVLNRECGELFGLSDAEFLDLLRLIKKFESGVKEEFGATMFNWTCLMNNSYKESNNEKPQVHFHVRPRYKDKVKFEGVVFEDKEFAHHYERKAKKKVSDEVLEKIVERVKKIMG